jgi:hypothetical protein
MIAVKAVIGNEDYGGIGASQFQLEKAMVARPGAKWRSALSMRMPDVSA